MENLIKDFKCGEIVRFNGEQEAIKATQFSDEDHGLKKCDYMIFNKYENSTKDLSLISTINRKFYIVSTNSLSRKGE